MTGIRSVGSESSAAHAGRLSAALWIAVPVLAGLVQLIRAAPVDAAVFFGTAALLAADRVGLLPPAVRERPRFHAWLLTGGGAVIAVVLLLTPRDGAADATVVAVVGVLVLLVAWPDPPRTRTAPPPERRTARRRGGLLWGAAALAFCGWELAAFLLGLQSEQASFRHPAFSDLLDPALDGLAGRALFVVAWLSAGYGLLRRGARR